MYHCWSLQEEQSLTCTVWWLPDTSSSLKLKPKAWQLHPDWSSSPQSMSVYSLYYFSFITKVDNQYLRCKSSLNYRWSNFCSRRVTIPLRKPVQLWALGLRTWSFWTQIRGVFHTLNPLAAQKEKRSNIWMLYVFFFFSRGRVIPADLEAKVIEAKQKVNLSDSDNVPSDFFICFYQRTTRITPPTTGVCLCQRSWVISVRLLLLSAHVWCCPRSKVPLLELIFQSQHGVRTRRNGKAVGVGVIIGGKSVLVHLFYDITPWIQPRIKTDVFLVFLVCRGTFRCLWMPPLVPPSMEPLIPSMKLQTSVKSTTCGFMWT